jgi:hypothetical protein
MGYNSAWYFGSWYNASRYNGKTATQILAEAAAATQAEEDDRIHQLQRLKLRAYRRTHIAPPATEPPPSLPEPGHVRPDLLAAAVERLRNPRGRTGPVRRRPVNFGGGTVL